MLRPSRARTTITLFNYAVVEIIEYQPALLHAKTVANDGQWVTVGSTNFDNRSFALNEEVNATIYDCVHRPTPRARFRGRPAVRAASDL